MLMLSRLIGQSIMIGDNIRVNVVDVKPGKNSDGDPYLLLGNQRGVKIYTLDRKGNYTERYYGEPKPKQPPITMMHWGTHFTPLYIHNPSSIDVKKTGWTVDTDVDDIKDDLSDSNHDTDDEKHESMPLAPYQRPVDTAKKPAPPVALKPAQHLTETVMQANVQRTQTMQQAFEQRQGQTGHQADSE